MQHRHEREFEPIFNHSDFAQSQIAIIRNLTIRDAFFDQLFDQLLNFLRRRFFDTPRRAFNNIGQANDRAFLRLRFRPAVTKTLLTHIGNVLLADVHDFSASPRVFLLLDGPLIKIINERRAVMFLNDVDDPLIEPVFQREINAFLDVRDDNKRAHRRREIIVRISLEVHVLGEIFRLHQFADVVKI